LTETAIAQRLAEAEAALNGHKKRTPGVDDAPPEFATVEESRSYANAAERSLQRTHAQRQAEKRKQHLAEWLHHHYHLERLYEELSIKHRTIREHLETKVGLCVATSCARFPGEGSVTGGGGG